MADPKDFLYTIATKTLYGAEAALRCGMATPLEKAEILRRMLGDAGFEAELILEDIAIYGEASQKDHFPRISSLNLIFQ